MATGEEVKEIESALLSVCITIFVIIIIVVVVDDDDVVVAVVAVIVCFPLKKGEGGTLTILLGILTSCDRMYKRQFDVKVNVVAQTLHMKRSMFLRTAETDDW